MRLSLIQHRYVKVLLKIAAVSLVCALGFIELAQYSEGDTRAARSILYFIGACIAIVVLPLVVFVIKLAGFLLSGGLAFVAMIAELFRKPLPKASSLRSKPRAKKVQSKLVMDMNEGEGESESQMDFEDHMTRSE